VRKPVRYIAGALGVATVAASIGLSVFGSAVMGRQALMARTGDGIVVLTGGHQRLAQASRLLVDGQARRLLISGVNRMTSRDDIRRMSLLPAGLFDCCVDIGYEALDTVGNADESRDWARIWKFSRLVVVTSDYHMPRSLTEFARAMPGVEIAPHAVTSPGALVGEWWQHPWFARRVVIEYVKFLPAAARLTLARLQTRIEAMFLATGSAATSMSTLAPMSLDSVSNNDIGPAVPATQDALVSQERLPSNPAPLSPPNRRNDTALGDAPKIR
jgi:uncharacterized SAM-binding protein YcdF (DUF218 family)